MASPLSPLSPSGINRKHAAGIDALSDASNKPLGTTRPEDHENEPASLWLDQTPSIRRDRPDLKRSPAKPSSPLKTMRGIQSRALTENALRENDNITTSNIDPEIRFSNGGISHSPQEEDTGSAIASVVQGYAGMDDTCFSTFSAVPNVDMTRFANLANSPSKNDRTSPQKHIRDETSSRPSSRNTPARSRWHQSDDEGASPTPRRPKYSGDGGNDTTNLLVDFTDHFSVPSYNSRRSPARLSPSKSATQPDLSLYLSRGRTPSPSKYPLPPGTPSEARQLANLLDFDLPPAPTPRSIPSITARELESMKSQFLSQISSLSAELRGKEAEVKSLKDAVNSAETRAGEAQEQLRDERGAKEALQGEKKDWEKRQMEMQKVLKDVKEEIIRSDREKDALLQNAQDSEHRREEVEARLVEAESKIEGLRMSVAASTPISQTANGEQAEGSNTQREVEAAVTKVAKELHGLYKSKHETKVTALKKSYSDRWEKRVRELTNKIDDLTKENEDLRLGRDATMTGVDPSLLTRPSPSSPDVKALTDKHEQELSSVRTSLDESVAQTSKLEVKVTQLECDISGLQTTLSTTQTEKKALREDLDASHRETADLMALSEELMSLSANAQPPSSLSRSFSSSSASVDAGVGAGDTTVSQPSQQQQSSLRGAFSRSTSGSGLKAPGSRIGRMGAPAGPGGAGPNGPNGAVGMSRERSGSGMGRSGILSNIERMGRGRET